MVGLVDNTLHDSTDLDILAFVLAVEQPLDWGVLKRHVDESQYQ
jgi:hypothetical protein